MPRRDQEEMPVEIERSPLSVAYVDVGATHAANPKASALIIEGGRRMKGQTPQLPFMTRAMLLLALGGASWIACLGAGQVLRRIVA